MVKNTNFYNLKELLKVYEPENAGFITEKESQLIKETLEIESMGLLELRNLRDFTVLYLSQRPETGNISLESLDKMSAVTTVIDQAIISKGGEV